MSDPADFPLRCTRCGRPVIHAGPPVVDRKSGRAYFPLDGPTQLDDRYSTGYCTTDGRMVQTVRAETEEAAVIHVKRPRHKPAEPDDMWPEGTNFGVRWRG
jgi:hypothetical protein